MPILFEFFPIFALGNSSTYPIISFIMCTKENLRKRLVELHRYLSFYLACDSNGDVTSSRLSSLMVRLWHVYSIIWCRDFRDFLKK